MRELMVNYRLEGQDESFVAHSHLEYEIYLFHQGTCRYLIHNQIYDLQPGDILIMDGLALHKPNVPKGSIYVRSHIHFTPQSVESILDELGAGHVLDMFSSFHHRLIRTNHKEDLKRIELLFREMDLINKHPAYTEQEKWWHKRLLLAQMLIKVNRLGPTSIQKKPEKKAGKALHAEKIAVYIEDHFHQKLSIEKIANHLNLSHSYVSHVFKEMTGYTVMEYVMASRLKQVKFLLETEPKKTLEQIAMETGFESVSHLSRFFKANVGMTAGQYRKARLGAWKDAAI